jgi:nitrate reductase NapAB chaperone NapD
MINSAVVITQLKSTDDWKVTITTMPATFVYNKDNELLGVASALDMLTLSTTPGAPDENYRTSICDVIIGGRVTAEKFVEDIQQQLAALSLPYISPIENAVLVETT